MVGPSRRPPAAPPLSDARVDRVLELSLVCGALALHSLKKFGLAFHTRDYQYYLHVFESQIHTLVGGTRLLQLHPDGNNALGFSGIDGFPHAGVAIHFSPITYVLSVLFNLGGELVVVLVYATAAAFGLVWLSRSFGRTVPAWPHAMVVVVLALPLMLFATFDLRLYTLLLSLALVLALAIHHHRPGWIVAGLVIVLFTTREESYYFSMVAACHLIATGRSRLGVPIAAGALLYGALLYRHFLALGGFTFELDRGVVLFLTAPVVLLALTVSLARHWDAVAGIAIPRRIQVARESPHWQLFAWLNLYWMPLWYHSRLNVADLRYFPAVVMLVLAGAVWVASRRRPDASMLRVGMARPLTVLLLTALGLLAAYVHLAARPLEQYRRIWELSSRTEPAAVVVTTYEFHQAFWRHRAFVWERMPAASPSDRARTWPDNQPRLERVVERADLFVLDGRARDAIGSLGVRELRCDSADDLYVCR